ncbi:MAG: 23S rRNA (adenine(2503)-C(2))-methyltransferase RlmN [Candidatus Cloacimonetes bacterium]|nr:23S rRNA (adenine(2503)-C(2))-methyltransferase RlmN [Candidatus Cloacimonadota bacterium]
MSATKSAILDLSPQEVDALLARMGHKPYRARQALAWIYQHRAASWHEMTDLPLALRNDLDTRFGGFLPEVVREARSEDGTRKLLLSLTDGARIEMVLIPTEGKSTLCISSQVGCARRCAFCATARMKLQRNLDPGEMVGQMLLARRLLGDDDRLTNIVLMGMGEPMDNLDSVLTAVRILQHERGAAFSPRRMTLSTCGVAPGIRALADSGIKLKLAVSLNAALDEKRQALMPVARTWPLGQLKRTLMDFARRTPFRVTLEYIMMDGFNMGEDDVRALRRFCGDLACKLNLIPYNPVPGLPWQRPGEQAMEAFMARLADLPVAVTLRRSRGSDVNAACGQLAASEG